MAKRSGAATPALAALQRARIAHTVREYAHDPTAHQRGVGYGTEAAQALGIAPERVFKTLVAEVDGALTVAVIPVARQLDLKALAAAVGGKRAAMADPAAAERATGYVLGGISPFGQRRRLTTVVDVSAAGFDQVLVSAGRRGLDVELSPADLVAVSGAVQAAVAGPR